jgi:hypothetical protein
MFFAVVLLPWGGRHATPLILDRPRDPPRIACVGASHLLTNGPPRKSDGPSVETPRTHARHATSTVRAEQSIHGVP